MSALKRRQIHAFLFTAMAALLLGSWALPVQANHVPCYPPPPPGQSCGAHPTVTPSPRPTPSGTPSPRPTPTARPSEPPSPIPSAEPTQTPGPAVETPGAAPGPLPSEEVADGPGSGSGSGTGNSGGGAGNAGGGGNNSESGGSGNSQNASNSNDDAGDGSQGDSPSEAPGGNTSEDESGDSEDDANDAPDSGRDGEPSGTPSDGLTAELAEEIDTPAELPHGGTLTDTTLGTGEKAGASFPPGTLKKGTVVEVGMRSTYRKIGEFPVGDDGSLSAEFAIPADAEAGDHTLVVKGVLASGEPMEVTQPVLIAPLASALDPRNDGNGLASGLIVSALVLAGGAAAMLTTRRRKSAGEAVGSSS